MHPNKLQGDCSTKQRCLFLWLLLLAQCLQLSAAQVACPWDADDLLAWSETSSWGEDSLPGKDDAITIPTGRAILMDVQPPSLKSLTIASNATLVWGDVDDITLQTGFLLVSGQMHIGSEECRFTKNANILLEGKSNSPVQVPGFGRKFIGVDIGGTLEIHGQPKMSWTKLTATVGLPEECSIVYDSRNKQFSKERTEGLHVTVWNQDGSLFDFTMFATEHPDAAAREQKEFRKYIQGLPDDKVFGIGVFVDIGNTDLAQEWESVYLTIEELGGKEIRKVKSLDPYVLVGITGSPSQTEETHTSRSSSESENTLEAQAIFKLASKELAFIVESIITKSRSPNEVSFRVTQADVAFPVLNVIHDVSSWKPGDQIVITSTDFIWEQAEVKTIVPCETCSSNQVRVKGEFKYSHFGEITYGVDERAEVGLLTRNVKIEGIMEDSCYSNTPEEKDLDLCSKFNRDTFGGHLKIQRGHSSVHIEGVELYHMGQQALVGSYPLHFHMCDDATGMWLRNNSIHESFARCVTIHGTDGVEVSDHVCYRHLGHGYFFEDSVEQNNVLHRNLGIGTMYGTHVMTDMDRSWCSTELSKSCGAPSTFWVTHPNNVLTNNVAAGSVRNGFMLTASDVPLGPSYQRQLERNLVANYSTRYTKVKEFSGNVAHSNRNTGLFMDNVISHGLEVDGVFIPANGLVQGLPGQYAAREPPTKEGEYVDTVFSRLTFYKNEEMDVWLRGANVIVDQSSFADSPIGFISAHVSGHTLNRVQNSIFIGETDNKGQPFVYQNRSGEFGSIPWYNRPRHSFDRSIADLNPEDSISGVSFYQGPIYVDNCYFDRYFNWWFNDSFQADFGFRPVRPGSALSFHKSSHYFPAPYSGTKNLKFGFCDGTNNHNYVFLGNETTRTWHSQADGVTMSSFRDSDGSLTGVAGAQVVPNRKFMTDSKCKKMEEWGMSICPYSYAGVFVNGLGGVLDPALDDKWPMFINRDDAPDDVINLKGQTSNQWTLMANKSYTLRFNTSLGDSPTRIRFKAFDLDRGEVIRFSVCLPKDTTKFAIYNTVPLLNRANMPTYVDNIEDLDNDETGEAIFWDKDNGLLYFKLIGFYDRTDPRNMCTQKNCHSMYIIRQDGGKGPASCDVTVPPFTGSQQNPASVELKTCTGSDSSQGLGALASAPQLPAPSIDQLECPMPDPIPERSTPEYRGCFVQTGRLVDMRDAYIKLYSSMTPQVCIDRCFQRNYKYCAIYHGHRCVCGDSFSKAGPVSDSQCRHKCSGDSNQFCGGNSRYMVYTTGVKIVPSAPKACGPGKRGVELNQNSCLYLSRVKEDFRYARRRCMSLGGDLVRIDSQEKQNAISALMRGMKSDAWAGLVFQAGQWSYLDGQPINDYNNWYPGNEKPSKSSTLRYYLKIVPTIDVKWFAHRFHVNNMALCELPMSPAPVETSCGLHNKGIKKGDGPCFATVHGGLRYKDAEYTCHKLMGRLAPHGTDDEKESIENFLVQKAAAVDYWVDKGDATSGKGYCYDFYGTEAHVMKLLSQSHEASALCVLDEPSEIDKCPTDWSHFDGNCYLSKGDQISDIQLASAYCQGEFSDLVTIGNEAENDFVSSLLPSKYIWLGIQYNPSYDQFIWSDNIDRSYSNWYFSTPRTYLSKGLCVVLDPSSKKWRNKLCYTGRSYVVCKMPVPDFN